MLELFTDYGRISSRLVVKLPHLSFVAFESTLNGCQVIERVVRDARLENFRVQH